VEPIKRQIASEQELLRKAYADSGAAGGPPTVPGYDPTRPWNLVFQRAVGDEAFWREEVVEPAYLVHSKAPWPYSKGCYSALQRSEAIWLRTSNKMH